MSIEHTLSLLDTHAAIDEEDADNDVYNANGIGYEGTTMDLCGGGLQR